MHNRARDIREGLDLMPVDPHFTVASRLEQNPLVWMFEINGMLADIREAPLKIQQAFYDQGLIPYIPGERKKNPSHD